MRDSERAEGPALRGEAISRALADRLEGMRERVHEKSEECDEIGCPGYQPVPPTAEGEIDVGRLIKAIEANGWRVTRAETVGEYLWGVYGDGYGQFAYDQDLAVAYLKAVGAWPLEEDARE